MSQYFKIANDNYNNGKYEDAITNYKKTLDDSKSNDEKYIACFKIHESQTKLNKENIYYLIESFKYDEKRVECIYRLILHYILNECPQISYSFYSLIQDYYENEFINDYENILKKPNVNISEYTFYLPYNMIILAYRVNKPEIVQKICKIIFKFKYTNTTEWWINNLFHNINLFLVNINDKDLMKECGLYLNLLHNKGIKINIDKLYPLCKYGLDYLNVKYFEKNKLKILFHMSDNRPIKKHTKIEDASYNGLAAVINYEYCKKYGYDFKYYVPYLKQLEPLNLHNCLDPNNNQPRHASWSKLLATQIALDSEYDYIIYLDSDCIVKNFNIPIESIIYGNENNNLIFFWNKPCTVDKPNTGVYICKNNLQTKLMMQEWYNVNIPYQNINRIWEQSALWEIYNKWIANYKNSINIIDGINMVEEDNQYLRHIMTGQSKLRREYFLNFIEKNKINYKINLDNITEIQFNTNLDNFKKIKESRIYLFLPYYGLFPNYLQLYFDSLSINNDILTVFIITDINLSKFKIPKNAIIINMSLESIKERITLFLKDEDIKNDQNIDIDDYKIIYPIIFEDIKKQYNIEKDDYVGWGNYNIIYGKLSNFLELQKTKYEIIGDWNNHFTAVSNNDLKLLYKFNNYDEFQNIIKSNNYKIFSMKEKMNDTLQDYLYFDKNNEQLVTIYDNGKNEENIYCHLQKKDMDVSFNTYKNIFYINQYSFTNEEKLRKLTNKEFKYIDENNNIINHLKNETNEQDQANKYITEDSVVLELGARYGTVSCIINRKIKSQLNQVSVEPDLIVLNALKSNMLNNECHFNILNGVISRTPITLDINGYGTTSVKSEKGCIKCYTLEEVEDMYNLKFNTLVADCEGFLEIFFDENPKLYEQLSLVMFEKDCPIKCNYQKIIDNLKLHNFKNIVTGFHEVWRK